MYFDSHAHLDDGRFDADRAEIFADLPRRGVGLLMNVGCDLPSSERSVALAHAYDFVYAAVGSHPDDAASVDGRLLDRYRALAADPRVRAIGEIGLDYHYEDVTRARQIIAFEQQLELAEALRLPVIVHEREAHGDAMDIVRRHPDASGVFHCFSGSAEMALWLAERGWYLGFTGVVTFKKSTLPATLRAAVPLDRIVVETDCPYLAPTPHRGKRNEPAYVPLVIEKLADIYEVMPEKVAQQTTETAKRLFHL